VKPNNLPLKMPHDRACTLMHVMLRAAASMPAMPTVANPSPFARLRRSALG